MNLVSTAAMVSLAVLVLVAGCSERAPAQQLASLQQLVDKKDYKTAIVALKSAIQKEPDSAAMRFLLGKVLFETGEGAPSLVELNKARELGHPDSQVLPLLVKVMVATGQSREAIDRYGASKFEDKADQAELQVSLAAAFAGVGRYAQSRAAVAQALALNPRHFDGLLLEAHALAGEGKADAAWALVEGVTRDAPDNGGGWYLKGMLQRYVKNDAAAATQSLRKALAIDPRSLMAHTEVLSILYEANDRKGMREQLGAMQAALPANLNTLLFRAQLEYLDGNLKPARDLLQQLMRSKIKSWRVLVLAAQIEVRLGSLALAETYLNNALQLRPSLASARHLLANVHINQGQAEKALQVLQPLLEQERPDAMALGLAAEALLQAGNLPKAQSYFDLAAKARPDDQRLKAAVALSHMAQGRFDQGLSELETVAAVDKDTFADLALISSYMRRKDLPLALRAIDRLQTKLPGKPLPHHMRGQVRLAMKDEAGARQSFAKALEVDPVYFPAAAALAGLDAAANNLAAAKSHYEAVLKRDPRSLSALLGLAELKRRNQEPAESITALLTDAVVKNPTEIQARVALAEYLVATRSYKTALIAAQEGLAMLPDAAPLLDVLGRAQLALQEYQQALNSFRKLATVAPKSPVPHMRMVDVHLAQRDLSSARQSLRRALEVSPTLLAAHVRLFELAMGDKNFKEALAVAREVQKARPNEGAGFLFEGKVLLAQKNWSGAAAVLRTSMKLRASTEAAKELHTALTQLGDTAGAAKHATTWRDQHPNDAGFVLHLGDSALGRSDWAAAEREYRSVLSLAPQTFEANNNLAWALMKQKKAGAVPFAEAAYRQRPGLAAVMDTYANALLAEGQPDKARKLADEALKADPTLHDARLTLARIVFKLGDHARAKQELETLLYLGDKFGDQAEVAELLRKVQ